jgi:gamma-glutamyltranspeptidase/glutathione hydrolase/leukotriene-C4 hydrolase
MIPSVVSWSGMYPEDSLPPGHLEKRSSINDERRRRRRVWEVLLVLLFLIVAVKYSGQHYIVLHLFSKGAEEADRSLGNPAYLIKAKHGAVASENELCSNIGVEILKDGGNAVDAAVATTFCIGVVNMFS